MKIVGNLYTRTPIQQSQAVQPQPGNYPAPAPQGAYQGGHAYGPAPAPGYGGIPAPQGGPAGPQSGAGW